MPSDGHLRGKQLQARDIAEFHYNAGFTGADALLDSVMVCLSESQGYDRAYNDNITNEKVTSRDVGLMQINIPASAIGTHIEEDLYDPDNNSAAAFDLWQRRGFQPWVGYTSEVYLRDTYLKRALRGVANFLAAKRLALPTDTLHDGQPYVHVLKVPTLDYQTRVDGQHVAITKARDGVIKAQSGKTLKAVKDELVIVRAGLAAAANLYKE